MKFFSTFNTVVIFLFLSFQINGQTTFFSLCSKIQNSINDGEKSELIKDLIQSEDPLNFYDFYSISFSKQNKNCCEDLTGNFYISDKEYALVFVFTENFNLNKKDVKIKAAIDKEKVIKRAKIDGTIIGLYKTISISPKDLTASIFNTKQKNKEDKISGGKSEANVPKQVDRSVLVYMISPYFAAEYRVEVLNPILYGMKKKIFDNKTNTFIGILIYKAKSK